MADYPTPGASQLKHAQREMRSQFSDALSLRIHRAISWFANAEQQADEDNRFIFLWIAFNSAYANEITDSRPGEKRVFGHFLHKIGELDKDKQLYQLVWQTYSSSIRLLLNNQYIFQPYWDWANGKIEEAEWQQRFSAAQQKSNKALAEADTSGVLQVVFSRLYTLRNQMVHGGATWQSSANRKQLQDANKLLMDMLPLIINIMMANPNTLWGDAIYPFREHG